MTKASDKDKVQQPTYDQMDAGTESTGSEHGRNEMHRPETPRAGEYNGSRETSPREEKPGVFEPQDDSPQVIPTSKDTTVVRSSGQKN